MEQPPTCSPTGPAGLVDQARALLAEATETLWAAQTPEALVAATHQLEMVRSQIAALQASLLTEVEERGIAKNQLAWGSTGDWFTHTAGTHPRRGRQTVRQAPILVRERTATHQALCAGQVSPEQATPPPGTRPNGCCSPRPPGSTPPP